MPLREAAPSFSDYRTVSDAAKFLGISTATLRNWDRSGKLKARRHPQNGYRIYLHEDLEAVLRSADGYRDGSRQAVVDWTKMGERDHFVQFYESDEYLVECVSGFVGAALSAGNCGIVIATGDHRSAIEQGLISCGIDPLRAAAEGRFAALDARETFSRFMHDGLPDRGRFMDTVGAVVGRMAQAGRPIHAFGEMVALLWANGEKEAAIRLEELWNELGTHYRFALYCAYPMNAFDRERHADPFANICGCHSRVIPAESYNLVEPDEQQERVVAALHQKAQSLVAEIAHREKVEEILARRERELIDFLENATEGLHKVGPDGTILWANRAECELLGYSYEEYVGRSIADFHADRNVIDDMLARLQRGETLENYPARLRCKNGTIKHVLVTSSACFEDGEFIYSRCFTRDVTREHQAETALREADRRKDEFLATLAHELRNPLSAIHNSIELMQFESRERPASDNVVSIAQRQVQQLSRLVDDLLDISRITRDKITLHRENVALKTIIDRAVEASRPQIDAEKHDLRVALPGQTFMLHADAARLTQVFSNLLSNSAKYTPPGGRIELNAVVRGSEAIVTVRDNGIGIPCDALAYIFDMFRQVDRPAERMKGGLGIGLTLVRRLVEMHGGIINAQSEGEGKGSEFVVCLPLARTAHVGSSPALPERRGVSPKRRVLVVDDNEDSRATLSRLLELFGHDVRAAGDGLEAVNVAESCRPDIILMDVGMPRLDGYEATRRIRTQSWAAGTLIVALTGWGQPSDVARASESGCSAHLVKPVDFAALEKLIASHMTSPS